MAKVTNDGKKGGVLKGKPHYDENGKPLGGIKAIVTDTGQEVELEGGEVIINKEAAEKHWPTLSKINQSAGGGVPILPPNKVSGWKHKQKKLGGELAKGVKVEKEHTDTIKKIYDQKIKPKDAPKAIAKDHLKESKKYYTELGKMEKQLAHGGNVDKNSTTLNGVTYSVGDMGDYGVAKIRSVIITRITATDWIYFQDPKTGKVDRDPVARFAPKFKLKTKLNVITPTPKEPKVETKKTDIKYRVKTEDEFIQEFGGGWRSGGKPLFTTQMDALFGKFVDIKPNEDTINVPFRYNGDLIGANVARWMLTEIEPTQKGHGKGVTSKGIEYSDGDQFKVKATGDELFTILGITKNEVSYTSDRKKDVYKRKISDFNKAVDGGSWYFVNKLTKVSPPKKAVPQTKKAEPAKKVEPAKKEEPINYVLVLENWVKQNLIQPEELTPEKILKESVATLSVAIEDTDKDSTKKLDEALQSISK